MRTPAPNRACIHAVVDRFDGADSHETPESLAVEEPLEIRIVYGATEGRATKSISVTMRTPGNDAELAIGFLLTDGILRDANDIASVASSSFDATDESLGAVAASGTDRILLSRRESPNVVTIELAPHVAVNTAALQRNFYTTSSCGVCGKASLLALRSVCPPRSKNEFTIDANTLYSLPALLRSAQGIFERTGGLHAAALFGADGAMDSLREDVGRHNAVDKLLGAALLADRIPLRNRLLLLSGRASFELVQKALMGGIPAIASVGAPSSLAVGVAKEFDITLVGFLRDDHFNVYNGAHRIVRGVQEAPRKPAQGT
jgi:FdhD protein